MNNKDQVSFDEVLFSELELVAEKRDGHNVKPTQDKPVCEQSRMMNLSALAFSGGGIRSAAFNLGFLQGLANNKALHLFDYLSTVSGGGYIGGWLSALLRRSFVDVPGERQVRDAQQCLATPPDASAKDGSSSFPPPEARPVRFLRRYANYLTPRLGLSSDTLALLASALRNVVVMQFLLISLLVAGFSSLMLLAGLEGELPAQPAAWLDGLLASPYRLAGADLASPGRWLLTPALGLLFVALVFSLWSQTRMRGKFGYRMPNTWVFLGFLAAISAGVLFALGIRIAALAGKPMSGGSWVLLPALGYVLAWSGSGRQPLGRAGRALLGASAGAASFALVLHFGMAWLSDLLQRAPFGYAVAFAPSVAMAVYSLVITVHLALAGGAISEQQREWWARAGGQGAALGLAWTLAFLFMLYVPPLIQYGAEWSVAGGGLWTVLSWLGAHLAQGKETGGKSNTAWKEIVARLVPWLFLGGLVGLVLWAYAVAMPGVVLHGDNLRAAFAAYHASLSTLNLHSVAKIALAAGGLFLILVVFVDLNLFSAHSFYRNRLARSFLGASREQRVPNAFTGFDPDDDMSLADLAGQRPIHLVNANLNIAGGQELAWQTRRGTSFVFTPGHCGFSARTSLGDAIGGYRETGKFAGGLSLATVIAVSGAAASPNMGFHTSTAVSALLTAFNLRLARWCPNPTREQWQRREPRWWSAGPLFAELFGEARDDSAWINLSDGGHFDNLGLYELARRRVGLIVVTDVGADGEYQFDDLAMAARKLSVDFGVRLDIDTKALDAIRPPADKNAPRFSENTWAVGRIVYPDCAPGILIYVKSALTKGAPVDIRQYRDAHPAFPHESTADQWFDEDQFEAYRHLGQRIAEEACEAWLNVDSDKPALARITAIEAKLRDALA